MTRVDEIEDKRANCDWHAIEYVKEQLIGNNRPIPAIVQLNGTVHTTLRID